MSPEVSRIRSYLITGAVVALIIMIFIAGVFLNHRPASTNLVPNAASNEANQAPEKGGQTFVDIQGTEQLANILLSQQFDAVKSELNSYILANVSQTTAAAQVSNTTVNNDGSMSFIVQTNNPSKQFQVNLDRSQYTTIGFSVPSTNFQVTLQVYGTSSN